MISGAVLHVPVPDGHPLAGQLFTLYPDNGATTYTEGTVKFVSPRSG